MHVIEKHNQNYIYYKERFEQNILKTINQSSWRQSIQWWISYLLHEQLLPILNVYHNQNIIVYIIPGASWEVSMMKAVKINADKSL